MDVTRRTLLTSSLAIPAFGRAMAPLAQDTVPTIKEVARANGFRFGSAAGRWSFQPAMSNIYRRDCDLITLENATKMKFVLPDDGPLQLGNAFEIIDWADRLPATSRAHAFIFTVRGMPAWIDRLANRNRPAAIERVLRYVSDVARELSGRVTAIDAVNEAVRTARPGENLLQDHWLYRRNGRDDFDVIVEAYERAWAHAGEATLLYNDQVLPYDDLDHPERRDSILRFLRWCRRENVRFQTVGIQSHLTHKPGRTFDAQIWLRFLLDIEQLGYTIAITELSASDCGLPNADPARRDAEIARAVEEYLTATLQARTITDIICWGVSDAHTHYDPYVNGTPDEDYEMPEWCAVSPLDRPVRALPYDRQFAEKPMIDAIKRAMENAPARYSSD